MALGITLLKRGSIDGSAFRIYQIAHDGSVTSISAGSMDLHYIEAIIGHVVTVSMQANTSLPLLMQSPSINASNTGVVWDETGDSALSTLTVIGW